MGCPTTVNGYTATWTRGKLAKLSKGNRIVGTSTYQYGYNALGQRISRSYAYTPGTGTSVEKGTLIGYNKSFRYDQSGRLIQEGKSDQYYNETGTSESIIYLYDNCGIIGMVYSGLSASGTYYFQRNLLGDVIGIYDTSGTKVGGYAYDAWGNCTITLNTNGIATRNPIRYRGYYYDEDTKLYFLNARYYSPEWRRFVSPDDTGYLDPESVNGLNLYAYCGNDPVNYADPSGHSATLLIVGLVSAAVIGGLISGGISAGTAYVTRGDVGAAFWGGFVTGALSSLAVGVGMAITGGWGLLACAGLGFLAGMGGNFVNQSISSYHESGSVSINVGDMIFSGMVNSLVCVATMGGMNLNMSDSFNPALLGKTFGSRFVEFMSFDADNTIASVIFGITYGLIDGAVSLAKYAIESTMFKTTADSRPLVSY